MKKRDILCLIAAATLAAACGRTATKSVPSVEPQPKFYARMPQPSTPETARDLYVEGIKRAEIWGDRAGAAEWFDRAIAADSTHSPSWFAAADNLADSDPARALEYSRGANRLDSADVWYRNQLARLLAVNGRLDEAMGVYRTLTGEGSAMPSNPEAYRMLSILHDMAGEPYRALAVLDSAETKFGKMEQITGMKREIYMKLRLFDRAIEASREMIEEYPFHYENYLAMSEIYAASGRDSLARANLQRARELAPGQLDVQMALAGWYRERGDEREFIAAVTDLMRNEELDVAAKVALWNDITRDREFYGRNYLAVSDVARALMLRHPNDYRVVDLYAGTLMAGGEMEEAIKVYKNHIADTASTVDAYTMVLDGETYLERTDSVERWAALAIERFPDNLDLRLRKGGALVYLKRYDEALDTYRAVLDMKPADSVRSVVHTQIGDLCYTLGREARSAREYEEALRYDPDNTLALNNYAYHLSVAGHDLGRALEMAARVMELRPDEATYIDTYGWVLFRMGRLEEARQALRQAVSLDDGASAEVLAHYGDVLAALGENYMAKYYWEKARDEGYDPVEIARRIENLEAK